MIFMGEPGGFPRILFTGVLKADGAGCGVSAHLISV
jgi:hypothetical protein